MMATGRMAENDKEEPRKTLILVAHCIISRKKARKA